ncbi:MAG: aliphatic sulfonate ABC transporter substrate-binding protein [Lachnospiraceae bacterium]|nr:aliphatic sulfonate ABC transporter substrate-binding protein [Lachnospiraceae bacterium]
MFRNHKRIAAIILSFILALPTLTSCGEAGTDRVRIAIQPSAAFIPLFVAKEKGWIEEALRPYNVAVTWNMFESGPPMNDSLLAGDSDIGVIGDVPVVTVCAPGNGVQVVAIAAQAADSYAILVPADSDIVSADDLTGKRVAATFGSTAHNMVEKYIYTAGLGINNIDLVNIAAGDAASVLSKGQAEAVSIWEPSVTRLTYDGSIKILAVGSEVGLAGTNAMVARKKFAHGNPEVMTAIIAQYKRAADELPTLDRETLDAVAKDLNLTYDQLMSVIPKFNYSVAITDEDISALNDTIRFLNENKIMRSKYNISESTDKSYYKGNQDEQNR